MPSASESRASAAFFDRDGVLNVDRGYVHRIDDFELLPGVAAALRLCRAAGFRIFVVTNQAGVAHGLYDEAAVQRLHRHMRARLADQGATIDDIRYCPHHPDAVIPAYRQPCECRKPQPGMLRDLMAAWHVDAAASFLIGDKPSDLEAAGSAGIRGYLYAGGDLADLVRTALEDAGAVRASPGLQGQSVSSGSEAQ